MQDPFIDAVFNGANAATAVAAGIGNVMQGAANTMNSVVDQIQNPQSFDQFSRRNFGGFQNPQQPQQAAYQPITSNPWGNPNPMQNNGVGYPGISNPGYGKTGYAGTAYSTPSFNFPSFGFGL